MMDYEKKYNEALNDMRAIYPNLKGDAKLAVEHAFPELRESEDERMRKHIVTFIMEADRRGEAPEECAKWLAYLEKQKEQKPAEWSEEDEKIFNTTITHLLSYAYPNNPIYRKEAEKCAAWLKSLSERFNLQPKQELSEEDEGMLQLIIKIMEVEHPNGLFSTGISLVKYFKCNCVPVDRIISWLKSFPSRFPLQPKQEWSEEDEKMIERLTRILESGSKGFHADYTKEGYAEALSWLKSLRPINQEWSEEDKEMFDNVLQDIENHNVLPTSSHNWLKAHFKSFRLKPHWKPSEEQIKALEEVRTIFHHHHLWDEINPILYDYEELMRDLYKLM